MNSPSRVATALACFAFAHVSLADTVHAIQGGGFYHHQSGWIFPETIGDFSLVGVPGDINGTVDVEAYYARVSKGVRTVASVKSILPIPPHRNDAGQHQRHASVVRGLETAAAARGQAHVQDGKSSRAMCSCCKLLRMVAPVTARRPR
jgi:hypothetical protein